MNNDTIQEFLVRLGFSVDQNSLTGFVGGIESASMRIAAFGAAMTAVAAVVVKSVNDIAQENRALGLLAQQLGSTAAAVDDFIDTADMLGISNETATNSLKTFVGNVSDAAMGIGRAKIVFEKLHVAVKDATGAMRPATEVMADLQEKMQGMGRAQQIRIMEKLGLDPAMLVMFNDAFGNTKYIADELGKIDVAAGFNLDKAIKESNQFAKSWKNTQVQLNLFRMLFSKMYEAIAVRMMPKIREGVEAFGKTVESARRLVMDNAKQIEAVLEPIIDVILRIGTAFMKLVGTAFNIISSVLKPVFDMMISVNEATDGWAGYIAAALIAWKVFNLEFLATPLGMVLAFSLAVLALVDDFMTWKEKGNSLFDWSGALPIINSAIELFSSLWGVVKSIITAVSMLVSAFANLFSGNIQGFLDNWTKSAHAFVDVIVGAFNTIKNLSKLGENLLNANWSGVGSQVSAMFNGKSAPSGSANGGNVVNQNTNIHVNGAQNPHATAQLVHQQQTQVNAQVTRNMRPAVR